MSTLLMAEHHHQKSWVEGGLSDFNSIGLRERDYVDPTEMGDDKMRKVGWMDEYVQKASGVILHHKEHVFNAAAHGSQARAKAESELRARIAERREMQLVRDDIRERALQSTANRHGHLSTPQPSVPPQTTQHSRSRGTIVDSIYGRVRGALTGSREHSPNRSQHGGEYGPHHLAASATVGSGVGSPVTSVLSPHRSMDNLRGTKPHPMTRSRSHNSGLQRR